jgi:hypothetical protein
MCIVDSFSNIFHIFFFALVFMNFVWIVYIYFTVAINNDAKGCIAAKDSVLVKANE